MTSEINWQGFLFGRQTACIELPKTMGADSCLPSYPEVRKAIIAQGYQCRVKGE